MRDYTNKTIYLGIDVHKKTYAVTAICEGQVVKKDSLKASPIILVAYCNKYFIGAKIESAYEAGFCGFHLHRCLEAEGIENKVIDAAGMEVAIGDRVKTDKRDSYKLASQLACGRLKGIHVPSPEREDKRILIRLRQAFAKERSRLACQLKSLLHQHGLISADDKKMVGVKWLKILEAQTYRPGLKYAIQAYIDAWRHQDSKVKDIEKELAKQADEDKGLESIYRSVPGIGPVSARVLANELEDMSHFSNERKLFSYTGLTPSQHSSGEHIRQGHITRHGKPILRKILIQLAWRIIEIDLKLGDIFAKLALRVGKKRAIIGIARRIIGQIRSCFKTGELYRVTTDKDDNGRYLSLRELELIVGTP